MSEKGQVNIRNVSKLFGAVHALRNVTLDFAPSSYVVLLGPSGSGKTTLLSVLGGFLPPTRGQVLINGQDVTVVPPARRPTATVFQDYALFPHMTVAENVGFGLSVRHIAKPEIAIRVAAALDLVGLVGLANRRITEASGGQRQRIALARALVTEPAILLLDEPLGALDLNLRRQMQDELRSIQKREERTFVHVTHDQEEAMAIADAIVIMKDGAIEDAGPPSEIYTRPRTRFSAQFMGESNILEARMVQNHAQTAVGSLPVTRPGTAVSIRPEQLSLRPEDGALHLGSGIVRDVVFQGSFVRLTADVRGVALRMRLAPDQAAAPGAAVEVYLRAGGATALEGDAAE